VTRIWLLAQTIPDELVERIPDDLRNRADEIVAEVQANPALLGILVVVGVVSAIIFFWGVVKQFFKAALFAGFASAAAWYWFFNLR
jgi:hypothetical protein